MKTRIATVGSCVTRDNFNSNFNPNYKMFFDLVLHQHQVSIPSLMSKEILYVEDESVTKLSDFSKRHLKSECNKEFLNQIVERKPEYLLMDFDGDVNFGVREISIGEYFTNNPKFTNISFLKKHDKTMQMKDYPEEYFNMWKGKIDKFFAFLKEEIPDCKVILVKARFSDEFEDGTSLTEIRKNKKIKTLDVDYMNSLWDKLDNYIIKSFDVEILDMTEKQYYLDPDHPWGAFYLHYNKDFYNDFLNKLLQIIIKNIYEELQNSRKTIHQLTKLEEKVSENGHLVNVVKKFMTKIKK